MSAENSKTSIIFIPGGWHTEIHAQPVGRLLEAHGYKVVPVRLTINVDVARTVTMEESNAFLASIIKREADAGQTIVFICHSVAGILTAHAIDQFLKDAGPRGKTALKHMIFLASFLNIMRLLTPFPTWFSMDPGTAAAKCITPYETFFHSMTQEDAQPYIEALTEASILIPDIAANVPSTWQDIPHKTYLACKQDRAIAVEVQKLEAEENGMEWIEIDTGHCPLITDPKVMSDAVLSILH